MISICIPTYEMKGKGAEYLSYSFNVLYQQTFKDFEIIISDHSESDAIKDLCTQWNSILNIKYIRNQYKRGNSSANTNNAIKQASGDIIKILFQDDFLYDEHSLQNQINCYNGKWLVVASCHYNGEEIYKPFYPSYHDNIQYGHNTIGSPSVIMFENNNILEFDENLIWLMDTDYHKRMYLKYGFPDICTDVCVVNREHSDQVSHTLATEEIKQKELKYVVKKYAE